MRNHDMNLKEFNNKLFEIIDQHDSFLLTTHENSDGDGIGAEIAFYIFLKSINKDVHIINQEKPAQMYTFLSSTGKIKTSYDLNLVQDDTVIFMLDYNEISRIGDQLGYLLELPNLKIRIDHHKRPERISHCISYIDDVASSTCEMVFYILYDYLDELDENLRRDIVTALYTGIIFDTNNFVNKNVSSQTFRACAALKDMGVDTTDCYLRIFENRSTLELKLLGLTLSSIEEFDEGRLVFYYTTQQMLSKCGQSIDITEGFSKDVKPSNGRDVTVYIREVGHHLYRVSLRSSHLDVQKVAEHFGGGGHKLASGFQTQMSLKDLKNVLLEKLAT